jgi:hypothetical protein
MISDLDIYRAAKLLVDRYREDAELRASGRADEPLAEGDAEGSAAWRASASAVEELQRERRPDEAVK